MYLNFVYALESCYFGILLQQIHLFVDVRLFTPVASFIDCLCSYNESRKCVSDLENEQMPSSMIEGIMAINDIVY
jgi:hypothetical protein